MLDVAAAEERYKALTEELGPVVGLAHGQMKAAERDAVMARFLSGEIRVLVATTVVEVGVDVPDATIMVIEHASVSASPSFTSFAAASGEATGPRSAWLLYKAPPRRSGA